MKREGKRFNVTSNQTIKKCPLCTKWKCHSHTTDTNIKELYNNDKEFRKDINKNATSRLALSIHGHLIEREEDPAALFEELQPDRLNAKRFVSGYIARNVGFCRKEHKHNYELKYRKDFREFSRFGKYYQKTIKLENF